jgi:AcrR family transcriptional regulator
VSGVRSAPTRIAELREAALTLFCERGYRATTMEDIADVVGMRGPSLYKHVEGKSGLLADVIDGAMTRLLGDYRRAVAGTRTAAERLRCGTEAVVRFHAVHPREAVVGNRELANLPSASRMAVIAQRDELERAFLTTVRTGAGDGSFVVDDPVLSTYAILEMSVGVAGWFREDGRFSADQVARHYGRIALRTVGARVHEEPFPPIGEVHHHA